MSNYSLGRWKDAERALGRPVLSNQVQFSLAHMGPLDDLVPHAAAEGRVVIAWSPLAQGLLSARYDATNRPTGGVRQMNALFLEENLTRATGLLDSLREVAATHDVTPAQVALAWLLHQPNVVAIPGASSVAQVEANAAAADIELADDEVAELTAQARAFQPLGTVDAARGLVGHDCAARCHGRAAPTATNRSPTIRQRLRSRQRATTGGTDVPARAHASDLPWEVDRPPTPVSVRTNTIRAARLPGPALSDAGTLFPSWHADAPLQEYRGSMVATWPAADRQPTRGPLTTAELRRWSWEPPGLSSATSEPLRCTR